MKGRREYGYLTLAWSSVVFWPLQSLAKWHLIWMHVFICVTFIYIHVKAERCKMLIRFSAMLQQWYDLEPSNNTILYYIVNNVIVFYTKCWAKMGIVNMFWDSRVYRGDGTRTVAVTSDLTYLKSSQAIQVNPLVFQSRGEKRKRRRSELVFLQGSVDFYFMVKQL